VLGPLYIPVDLVNPSLEPPMTMGLSCHPELTKKKAAEDREAGLAARVRIVMSSLSQTAPPSFAPQRHRMESKRDFWPSGSQDSGIERFEKPWHNAHVCGPSARVISYVRSFCPISCTGSFPAQPVHPPSMSLQSSMEPLEIQLIMGSGRVTDSNNNVP
jgi:hypothetical protein